MPRLYVLDDDPAICELVEGVGRTLGYKVEAFATIRNLTRRLALQRPDVLVVDGLLPDGDGLTFLRHLVKAGKPSYDLIFLSAYFKDMLAYRQLRDLGVAKVLHKPISAATLAAELSSLTDLEIIEMELKAEIEKDQSQALFLEFDRLRSEYCHNLPALAESIEHLLEDEALDAKRRAEQLWAIAHRLAGSASTYGLGEISDLSSKIEEALSNGAPSDTVKPIAKNLVALLRSPGMAVPRMEVARPLTRTPRLALLVDDDSIYAEMLRRDLEAAGIQLLMAHSAAQALQIATERSPDVVLLDYDLAAPAEGSSLGQQLRALLPRETPFIFMTLHHGLAERIEAASAGVDLYLSRPLTGADILSALETIFRKDVLESNVLIVDDDPGILQLVESILSPVGVRVRSTLDSEAFWKELEEEKPSLILLDAYLPVYSGFQLCRVIKADPRFQDVPVLFISARSAIADRTAAFQAGADEYLVKPLVPEEFRARILARLRQEGQSRRLAYHDPLTGLISRRAIDDILSRVMSQLERQAINGNPPLRRPGIAIFDVDDFEKLNDSVGHLVGDAALRRIALGFRQAVRASDCVARWGGEEFLVLLNEASAEAFEAVFARLRGYLREYPVEGVKGGAHALTCSAGATLLQPGETPVEALRRADAALYEAKGTGKDRLRLNPQGLMPPAPLDSSGEPVRRLRCVSSRPALDS